MTIEASPLYSRAAVLAVAVAEVLFAGVWPTPGAASDSNAGVTADGLKKIRWGVFPLEFERPGASLAAYEQVLLDPLDLTYDKKTAPPAVDTHQLARIRDVFQTKLTDTLKKGGYRIASRPGPDVLRVQAAAYDLDLNPRNFHASEGNTYLTSKMPVTLMANLRDSESGQILYRVAKQIVVGAEGPSLDARPFWQDMEQAFHDWGLTLNRLLERGHH